MFIWLGSGRAKRRKIGARGWWLDAAANAGLPAPSGAFLLEEFHQFALDRGLLVAEADRLLVPDAELLVNTIVYSLRLPPLPGPLDVRPIFSVPDRGDVELPPGTGETIAQADDIDGLAAALRAAWAAALPPAQPGLRRDVLLLQRVEGAQTGSATSRPTDDADIIYPAGEQTPIHLPRLSRWGQPDPDTPAHLGRLQMLLRGLRRTLGPDARRVDYSDDGHICRLTRIEPA